MNKRKITAIIGLILIVAILAVLIFPLSREPTQDALDAMKSDDLVTVTEDDWIIFDKVDFEETIGFIFYPGGKVDARAYAPLARSLAMAGLLVIITPFPFDYAFFGINYADDVLEAYPSMDTWILSGHSLGGAMASSWLENNYAKIPNLVLLGSYPSSSADFTSLDVNILSIYGSEDGGYDGIIAAESQYPETAIMQEIIGGNHAQFGNYGLQSGDGDASIVWQEQQRITVNLIMNFSLSI